jgi:hypothetical protein
LVVLVDTRVRSRASGGVLAPILTDVVVGDRAGRAARADPVKLDLAIVPL